MSINEFAAAAGIDINEVTDRFSGNSSLLVRMIKKFPGDTAFYDIAAAMDKKDYNLASDAAHSLKGLSGNLGFSNLYGITSRMNQAGKKCDFTDFERYFSELKLEYDRIVAAIHELD